jgi:hypothetical protein
MAQRTTIIVQFESNRLDGLEQTLRASGRALEKQAFSLQALGQARRPGDAAVISVAMIRLDKIHLQINQEITDAAGAL